MTSAPLPMPTPRLTPCPASASRKASAWLTPPLAATTRDRPAGTSARAGHEAGASGPCGARGSPEVFGPSSRMPVSAATAASCVLVRRAPRPASRETAGADQRGPARRRAAASAQRVGAAGRRHAEDGQVDRPPVPRRLPRPTRARRRPVAAARVDQGDGPPRKAASERAMAAPSLPGLREAPTTATPRGREQRRQAGAVAIAGGAVAGHAPPGRRGRRARRSRPVVGPSGRPRAVRARRCTSRACSASSVRVSAVPPCTATRSGAASPRRAAAKSSYTVGQVEPRVRRGAGAAHGRHGGRRQRTSRRPSAGRASAVTSRRDPARASRECPAGVAAARAPCARQPPSTWRDEVRVAAGQPVDADAAGEEVEGELRGSNASW